MPPLKPEASERKTLLKLREELTSSALVLDMRVSIIIAIAGLKRLVISREFRRKEVLPAPLQFQTRIFISNELEGMVWWTGPNPRSLRVGVVHSCASGFNRKRKVWVVGCQ